MKHAKLELSEDQERAVALTMKRAAEMKDYDYPWDGLEADLSELHGGSLKLLGYGSLINRESAARTLTSDVLTPTVAIGARRIFNYESNRPSLAPSTDPRARAVLNVVVTRQREDLVNGMLIEVPLEDIKPLRDREIRYDLKPVACVDWNRRDEPPFVGYILECSGDGQPHGKQVIRGDIEPNHRYYRLCRDGVTAVDEEFLQLWLDTTYLADGKTPVRDWEASSLPLDGSS